MGHSKIPISKNPNEQKWKKLQTLRELKRWGKWVWREGLLKMVVDLRERKTTCKKLSNKQKKRLKKGLTRTGRNRVAPRNFNQIRKGSWSNKIASSQTQIRNFLVYWLLPICRMSQSCLSSMSCYPYSYVHFKLLLPMIHY